MPTNFPQAKALAKIKDYDQHDYLDIVPWFQDRGFIAPSRMDLPKNGKIVPGVAAGFLVSTDTTVAILEYFIANPKTEKARRDKAINQIANGLIAKAVQLGFRYVKCNSNIEGIKNRALALGFEDLGDFRSFFKEIVIDG